MTSAPAGPGRDALFAAFIDSFVRLQRAMGTGWIATRSGVHSMATGLPLDNMNEIWVAADAPDGPALGDAIERMRDADLPFRVRATGDSAATSEITAAAGLRAVEPMTLLVIDHPVEVRPPAGFTVTESRDGDIDAMRRIAARGFDTPDDLAAEMYPTALFADAAVHGYLGWVDGTATSAGLSITATPVVPVFGVATDPGCRRRGHAAAIMARILDDAFAAGARWVALEPSEEGWPLYRSLGFTEAARWPSWTSEQP